MGKTPLDIAYFDASSGFDLAKPNTVKAREYHIESIYFDIRRAERQETRQSWKGGAAAAGNNLSRHLQPHASLRGSMLKKFKFYVNASVVS